MNDSNQLLENLLTGYIEDTKNQTEKARKAVTLYKATSRIIEANGGREGIQTIVEKIVERIIQDLEPNNES